MLQIPWKIHNFTIPVQSHTVHSCQTTVLSWASQLPQGAVSSEQRHLQGHHSYQSSMRLYSKDDVFGALQLQSVVINHIQKGMRPVQPVHRGGQEAFPTPSVELERVFFKELHNGRLNSSTVSLGNCFRFDFTGDVTDSESSQSDESDAGLIFGKRTCRSVHHSFWCCKKFEPAIWYGITKLTVHAMIADPNPTASITLNFQGIAVKTACGRRMSMSSIQIKEDLEGVKVPAFC